MSLRPCPSCSRHVRATETACPFCSAVLPPTASSPPTRSLGRLGRAAIFAFGAATTTTAVACGDGTQPTPSDSGSSIDSGPEVVADGGSDAPVSIDDFDANVAPLYGAPPPDASEPVDAPASTPPGQVDSGTDAGGPAPLYGGPPKPEPDGGSSSTEPDAGGGIAPLYGGVPSK